MSIAQKEILMLFDLRKMKEIMRWRRIALNPGLEHEDLYTHINKFYEIVGTLSAPKAGEEQVFMRLFPHSSNGKAKECYLDQPT